MFLISIQTESPPFSLHPRGPEHGPPSKCNVPCLRNTWVWQGTSWSTGDLSSPTADGALLYVQNELLQHFKLCVNYIQLRLGGPRKFGVLGGAVRSGMNMDALERCIVRTQLRMASRNTCLARRLIATFNFALPTREAGSLSMSFSLASYGLGGLGES